MSGIDEVITAHATQQTATKSTHRIGKIRSFNTYLPSRKRTVTSVNSLNNLNENAEKKYPGKRPQTVRRVVKGRILHYNVDEDCHDELDDDEEDKQKVWHK